MRHLWTPLEIVLFHLIGNCLFGPISKNSSKWLLFLCLVYANVNKLSSHENVHQVKLNINAGLRWSQPSIMRRILYSQEHLVLWVYPIHTVIPKVDLPNTWHCYLPRSIFSKTNNWIMYAICGYPFYIILSLFHYGHDPYTSANMSWGTKSQDQMVCFNKYCCNVNDIFVMFLM
jgi:hypothetical protein